MEPVLKLSKIPVYDEQYCSFVLLLTSVAVIQNSKNSAFLTQVRRNFHTSRQQRKLKALWKQFFDWNLNYKLMLTQHCYILIFFTTFFTTIFFVNTRRIKKLSNLGQDQKLWYLLLHIFLALVLKVYFCRNNWTPGCVSMQC